MKKPEKNQVFNGIRTHDLCDTGAMLYQLSYEATHWKRGEIFLLDHYLGEKESIRNKIIINFLLPEDDKSTGSGSLLLSNLKTEKKNSQP